VTAAAPIGPRLTREVFRPQPAEPRALGCPNCHETTALVLHEWAVVATGVECWDVGVTMPDMERDGRETVTTPLDKRAVYGVECTACRWSVKADPAALGRLT